MKKKQCKFIEGKKYYLPDDDAMIKFIEETREGRFTFKYVDHSEWEGYSTGDGSEIYESKKEYLKEQGVDNERVQKSNSNSTGSITVS